MAKCIKLQRKRRKICVGDLDSRITLQTRTIKPPVFGETDFDEEFTATQEVWAMINTVEGKTHFNGVETETPISHSIGIRYRTDVTAETWILLSDGRRLDILETQDVEERHEFLILTCTDRGDQEASKA